MQRCIRVLRSVTALGERAVDQDLCDQGAINQLLGNVGLDPEEEVHCKHCCTVIGVLCLFLSGVLILMEAASDEDDAVTVETMSNIQLILSALCETDLHRKARRQKVSE